MPRFNVEYKGRWACFSSVPDGFITRFMDRAAYEAWRREEYGHVGSGPLAESNLMDMADAVESIFLNRSREEGVAELRDAGLAPADIDELVQ